MRSTQTSGRESSFSLSLSTNDASSSDFDSSSPSSTSLPSPPSSSGPSHSIDLQPRILLGGWSVLLILAQTFVSFRFLHFLVLILIASRLLELQSRLTPHSIFGLSTIYPPTMVSDHPSLLSSSFLRTQSVPWLPLSHPFWLRFGFSFYHIAPDFSLFFSSSSCALARSLSRFFFARIRLDDLHTPRL